MAEQTSTSRSLNYGIDKHILDRIQKAGEVPEGQVGMIGDVFTDIQEQATLMAEAKQQPEDARLQASLDWDASFEELGNRGSWSTPDIYDQVFSMNEEMKVRYLEAVDSGDKALQAEILKEQQNLSNYTQNWKLEVEDNIDMFKKGLYSNSLQSDAAAEDRYIMESLNKMTNANFVLNDKKEMEFRILTAASQEDLDFLKIRLDAGVIDEDEYNREVEAITSDPNSRQSVTLRDVQNIKEKYIKSEVVKNQYLDNANAARTLGRNGGNWEASKPRMYSRNAGSITKTNIQNLFYDDFTESDTSFMQDMLNPDFSHPDWDSIQAKDLTLNASSNIGASNTAMSVLHAYDTNDEPGLQGDELATIYEQADDTDRQAIMELMVLPANFEIAKAYLAEWMTLKQKTLFDEGASVYTTHGPQNTKNTGSRIPK